MDDKKGFSIEDPRITEDRKNSKHVTADLLPKTVAGVKAMEYREVAKEHGGPEIVALAEPRNDKADYAIELIASDYFGDSYVVLRLNEMGQTVGCITIVRGSGFAAEVNHDNLQEMPLEGFTKLLNAVFPKEE